MSDKYTIEDLKCCGNCMYSEHIGDDMFCLHDDRKCAYVDSSKVCNKWQFDGNTASAREIQE